MRSKTVDRLLKNTPKDIEIFVDWYSDIVVRVNQLLRENKITQKDLAERMDKRPSEISKWLSGEHNFTLRSLAKLSAELGELLIEVPMKKAQTEFVEDGYLCRVHTFVSRKKIDTDTASKVWHTAEQTEIYNDYSYAG